MGPKPLEVYRPGPLALKRSACCVFVMSVVALGLENQTARRRSAVAGSKVCAQALDYGVGSALRVTKAEDTGSTITLAENVCTARLHFLRRGVATAQPSFSYTKRSKNYY